MTSKPHKSPGITITKDHRTKKSNPSIFKSISDPISVELFKNISETGSDSEDLIRQTRVSRRQYYSRLSNITRNGMVVRKNGKYYRTTFGRVVYYALMTIEKTFVNYYKLKAVDSIGLYGSIPAEEHNKIVESLITDPDIRKILVSVKNKDVSDNRLVVET